MIQWETEREGKKEQRSNLEKWMKSVRDPSVGEQLHKVEKRTIRAPILGQQVEVCMNDNFCISFVLAELTQ